MGKIVSFELECGRGLSNNFVIPVERAMTKKIPNEFLFVSDPGWNWFPTKSNGSVEPIVAAVLQALVS